MRCVALFCILGLFCGPVQAQDFFIEQSDPAHGNVNVSLSDTVAFSFNKQVAISTDFNTEFAYRPSDSLTFDEVSLCLTFLGECDAADDIPRHVRYQVEHQSDTDYTWLVYGVQTVDGDSMSVPYTLRYSTAPEIGQGEVSGSVTAPVPATSLSAVGRKKTRPSMIRATLRKLAEGLTRSELGRPVFEEPESSLVESEEPKGPADRPKAQFKTVGRKAASDGPYTQILLVDEFSIDEDTWSVRAADALIGSSGDYSLDFVRSGSYVPIAVRYTDGASTEIDALGFHDPDGDGSPNTIDVNGDKQSGIDLQLLKFPRTTARAEENLTIALDSAAQHASDQELRWIEAENGINPSSMAFEWTYRFYSPAQNLETEVTVNPLEVTVHTSEAGGFITEMGPIPNGFVDSDAALDTALANGGQEFVDQFPSRNLTTVVSGGNLFWADPPDETAEFWRVRFIGVTGSTVETLERFINIRSGDVLPVEMTNFVASATEDAVQLRWRTASETNNAGFEVQHAPGDSTVEADWRTLDFVEGAGTTQRPQTYRFQTTDLPPGVHRFRLKQRDLDGTEHLSKVAAVTLEMNATLRLTLPSPNPAHQSTTFRFGVKDAASATLAVYDVLGRKVATLHEGPPPTGRMRTVRLKTDHLPSGPYFVRLTTNAHTQTRKFTVVE